MRWDAVVVVIQTVMVAVREHALAYVGKDVQAVEQLVIVVVQLVALAVAQVAIADSISIKFNNAMCMVFPIMHMA